MERPISIKDKEAIKYIEYLENELQRFKSSPYVKTYLTIYNQLADFNDQLTITTKQVNGETVNLGRVDLFSETTDKSFDRIKWYFEHILELNKNLDELRKLMTPLEQKELNKQLELKNLGVAERIALKNGRS